MSAAGSVQEGGALPLSGRDLVPARQEGEGAPGSHHQSHRGPVQLRHQLRHHHLPQQPRAEGQPEGQAAGALDRRGPGEQQQQQPQKDRNGNKSPVGYILSDCRIFISHPGVSDLEELLLVEGHPLGAAVQRHPPPQEDLGGGVAVRFCVKGNERSPVLQNVLSESQFLSVSLSYVFLLTGGRLKGGS